MKSKGEKERYTHLNAEFQRLARRDKKVFLSDQCKEIEENNRMGKTRDIIYVEYIIRNSGLDKTQAGIKNARRNIINLRYADDTTLVAESEEELKSFLMKEESENIGLKLNNQKTKIMAFSPTFHDKYTGKQWKQQQTLCFWAPKSLQMVTAAMKLKDGYSLEEKC